MKMNNIESIKEECKAKIKKDETKEDNSFDDFCHLKESTGKNLIEGSISFKAENEQSSTIEVNDKLSDINSSVELSTCKIEENGSGTETTKSTNNSKPVLSSEQCKQTVDKNLENENKELLNGIGKRSPLNYQEGNSIKQKKLSEEVEDSTLNFFESKKNFIQSSLPTQKIFTGINLDNLKKTRKNNAANSAPNSPMKESNENSRRTRCSFNPDFAEKQKKFLAMFKSASHWDENEISDNRSENSSKNECDSSNHSGDSDQDQNEMKNDEKDVNKFTRKRGRPTKEAVRHKMNSVRNGRRKSARFEAPSEKSSLRTPTKENKFQDEQPIIIDDKDRFCWRCHRVDNYHTSLTCVTCPRVFHIRCIRGQNEFPVSNNWSCPECAISLKMDSVENQSQAMRLISSDEFCSLLTMTIEFLESQQGAEVFTHPVDLNEFPNYRDFIVNPIHLRKIQENVDKKLYGSTESFVADIKWLYHNSVIFNGLISPLTSVAKSILVKCKSKMNQLEQCVDCFKKSFDVTSSQSFLEVCRQPHLLVWAKFKGYPYWPSKVFHWKMDNKNNYIVDVKFFNDYSRAWVPSKSVYLFSKKSPGEVVLMNSKDYKSYLNALTEVNKHICNLEYQFGKFVLAPPKTEFDPEKFQEHLKQMLPEYNPQEVESGKTSISIRSSPVLTDVTVEGNFTHIAKENEPKKLSKKLIGPKCYKERKLKRLHDADVGEDLDESLKKEHIKKPKIVLEEMNQELLAKHNITLSKTLVGESLIPAEFNANGNITSNYKSKSTENLSSVSKLVSNEIKVKLEQNENIIDTAVNSELKEPTKIKKTSNDAQTNGTFRDNDVQLVNTSLSNFSDLTESSPNNASVSIISNLLNSSSQNVSDSKNNSSKSHRTQNTSAMNVKVKSSSVKNNGVPKKHKKSSEVLNKSKSDNEVDMGSPVNANICEISSLRSHADDIFSSLKADEYSNAVSEHKSSVSKFESMKSEKCVKKLDFPTKPLKKKKSGISAKILKSRVLEKKALNSNRVSQISTTNLDSSTKKIGHETEPGSLRINPTSLDHESSITRRFNFSVQQLVPHVSEALNDIIFKMAKNGDKDAQIQNLRLELERTKHNHLQEMNSLKHIMTQQFLEFAHTNEILRKQTEQMWRSRVAELEALLLKDKDNNKKERDTSKTAKNISSTSLQENETTLIIENLK